MCAGQQNLGEHHEHMYAHPVCFPKADYMELRTPGSDTMGNQIGKHKEKKNTLIIITWKNIFPTSSHAPTQSIKQKPDVIFTVCTETPVHRVNLREAHTAS